MNMNPWRIIWFLLLSALPVYANELTLEQSKLYQQIAAQTRCVTCQNQSIAESNAPIAKAMQAYIKEQIVQGYTQGQIEQRLIERYGDFVTYNPPVQGNTLGLWVGPLVFLFLAISLFARQLKKEITS